MLLAVVLQAKMAYSQTLSSPEYQVNQRRDARMQAATFESFLTTAILSQIQMGKRSSIEIARYARTLISCRRIVILADMIWATNLMCLQKKGPSACYCLLQYNTASSY